MTKYKKLKRIYEGLYVADVEVEFIEDEGSWTPHISMADAYRLDDVRAALKEGDLALATQYGQVYELRPVISA